MLIRRLDDAISNPQGWLISNLDRLTRFNIMLTRCQNCENTRWLLRNAAEHYVLWQAHGVYDGVLKTKCTSQGWLVVEELVTMIDIWTPVEAQADESVHWRSIESREILWSMTTSKG